MTINIILSSVVIATIFSGLVSYLISRKQANLQYITGERKEWRNKMRKIALELNGASYRETLKNLTELKVRINAFGNNKMMPGYFGDAHIWKVINELENEKVSGKILCSKQKQLIEYISLILKYDWERSKNEVKNDTYNIVSWLMFFCTGVYFTFSIFMCNVNLEVTKFDLWSLSAEYIIVIIASNAVLLIIGKASCKEILYGKISKESNKYNNWKLGVCYAIWGVYVIVECIIYGIIISSGFKLLGNVNGVSVSLLALMYVIGLALQTFCPSARRRKQLKKLLRSWSSSFAKELVDNCDKIMAMI